MWFYAFLPIAVGALGGAWSTMRVPSPKMVGAIQHFAAGLIFYAAAGELLPDVLHGAVWSAVIGGAAGIAVMLLLAQVTKGYEGPVALIVLAAVDALIDGVVLGLGFDAGQRQGTLIAIALSMEFLFLGLSIAGAFGAGASKWKVIAITAGVALAVPPGMLIAQPIATLSPAWQAVAFSFGLVALLYLVTEELLIEAHERPETPWGTAMFFVGFLSLEVIDRAMVP
ncbi:ZIP family metal transporter [Dongia sp.]|uniref:ZIP family metal transporter n=1 Tax=Dongia sp. TaxID=1977262 RepID=UPI003753B6D8